LAIPLEKLRYIIQKGLQKDTLMTVAYPRKFNNSIGAREILAQVIRDREAHLITLNRYRYNEQRSCKDLTNLIELLDGKPATLVRDLSRHVSDEARHAVWLTELLVELGADVGTPPGSSYIEEFERLLDSEAQDVKADIDGVIISSLAAINVTEKRGCEYFSAHIYALKQAPQTEENIRIRETIEKIFPEEAAHVRWGTRLLAEIADKSPEHRHKVEIARRRYTAIEQAAYEAGMDFTMGAELRRVNKLLEISETMPPLQRAQYVVERLPQTLLAPDLQKTRIDVAQRAWKRDPQAFVERLIPMFFQGLNRSNIPVNKDKQKDKVSA